MMRRMRTLTAWLLAVVLLVSSLPLGVMAQTLREFSGSIRLANSMIPVDQIATVQVYNEAWDTIVSTQYLQKGVDRILRPATPEKENWKFEGWYTAVNGGGSRWDFNQTVSEDVNLYPFFKELRYVFFHDDTGYAEGGEHRVILTKQGVEGESFITGDVSFPMSSLLAIEGWYDQKNPNPNQMPALGNRVENGLFRDISTNGLALYPRIVTGNYLSFSTSPDASYIKPQFVAGNGVTVEPANPTRQGYTFDSWVTTEGGDTPFVFGDGINAPTTIYAKWTPNAQTPYTVVFWRQQVSDDKNATDAEKKYDFAEAVSGRTAATGSSVSPRPADRNKNYTGFHYNGDNSGAVTVKGDGTTVLNVYYDRNELSIKFHEFVQGHWEGFTWVPGAWENHETFTGLYGQTLDQNNYTWPSEHRWSQWNNSDQTLTFLDSFIFEDLSDYWEGTNGNIIRLKRRTHSGSSTITHYKQSLDSNIWTVANSLTSGGGTFTFTNKYTGFTVSQYRTNTDDPCFVSSLLYWARKVRNRGFWYNTNPKR